MYYIKSQYSARGGTAIQMYADDGIPWCSVTINLVDYNKLPEDENHIFIPAYKLDQKTLEIIQQDIVEQIEKTIYIGPYLAECLYARLKPNWKDLCKR